MNNTLIRKFSRRQMLSRLMGAFGWLTAVRFDSLSATVTELPHLSDANPAAASLGYTEDASNVDAKKFPAHQPGQQCATCKYFQGDIQAQYAACQLYPGNAVNAHGWCAGYAAK